MRGGDSQGRAVAAVRCKSQAHLDHKHDDEVPNVAVLALEDLLANVPGSWHLQLAPREEGKGLTFLLHSLHDTFLNFLNLSAVPTSASMS